ncbi:hypothetical protein [Methylobacterium sp. yr668]|uniref:hypothetical protein n=1 Tax=Methylobacterium sp. yr668 TaxID=1761801 RepID=UPI0008DEF8BA|nr:hypothetical protein [Methylobacterium sp. yr668]SFT21927.1 hypothetical protein SAMN04487845_1262 [Methylobacterium sp. yr668]
MRTPDRKARAELLARQFAARLAAEGLSVKTQRNRKSLEREAKTEAAERDHLIEMRRRPSYAAVEAQQPFEPETRLIKPVARPSTVKSETEASGSPVRLTYDEMRAQRNEYPVLPADARDYERRRREQRRERKRQSGRRKK